MATLKFQIKSGRMVPSHPGVDVGKLKDEKVAEEFANRLSGDLGGVWVLLGILKSCGVPSRPQSLMLPEDFWNSLEGEEEFCLSREAGYH